MQDMNSEIGSETVNKEGAEIEQFIFPDLFAAARGLQTPIWVFDIDNARVVFANAQACHMWQAKTEKELRERDMSQDMSPTVSKRLKQYQADFLERDAYFKEMWTLYPNGVPTSVMVVFRGFRLLDGRMAMQCEVLGQADDEPENLRSAEALLHTDVMITLYAVNGPPLYMNPAARNATDDSSKTLSNLFVDQTDYDLMMFELDGAGEHRQVAKVSSGNQERWFDLSAKQCSDAVTGEPAILLTAIDVSELKIARDKARYLADRDQLTGCYNRAFLQKFMGRLGRKGSLKSALLYFDVDRFKQINDTFGHELGDIVLRELAQRSQKAMEPKGIVVRLGGDEFVVLFENIDDDEEFMLHVERLFADISSPIFSGTTSFSVHASMGIAVFDPSQSDLDTVLRQADIALYASKKGGRNRYTVYDEEMGLAAQERVKLEYQIKEAIDNQEFLLHLQPRIDVKSGQIVSAEGLARWEHPRRGLMMPNTFIPICEETGMIEKLGQQVLEMGFDLASRWRDANIDCSLSVNISPRQFANDRMMDALRAYSEQPGFPHGKIELEVTETVLIGDHHDIAARLQRITDMGYQVAIDDFGTGYSNLSYISRFPLNCLKIDRSFVSQLPASGPIIRLILALGKQIGATIVAEGVETKEQYDWLCEHDCDQIQGYWVARPAPLEAFEALFNKMQDA